MPNPSFEQISQQVQDHIAEGTFAQGMALADQSLAAFPEQEALINYWRVCLAARLDDKPLAYRLLGESLDKGLWYSEVLLRQSPSLKPLQGLPEFESLFTRSLELKAADPTDALPVLVVRPQDQCSPGDMGCPALIFLHGNQNSAHANLAQWARLAERGWVVALPQSTQALWKGAYSWTEHAIAAAEVQAHFQKLTAQYAIDPNRVILAGFSMGAEVALRMALSGAISAKGFILLGPGGPFMDDLSQWDSLLEQAQRRSLRGSIIIGQDDATIPQDNVRKLVETLNANGVSCRLEEHSGLGHAYPPDFPASLQTALAFIFD